MAKTVAVKEYTPQPFEALVTDPANLLFVDLKKDWVATANLDAIKYELKADGGVKNTLKVERSADGKAVSGSLEIRLPAVTAAALEPVVTADTKRKLKVGVSQANKLVPGLKTTATLEAQLLDHKQDLKLAFDYKRANVAAKVEFSLPVVGYVPSVAGSASTKNSLVFGAARDQHEVNVGVEFDYSLASSFVKALNVLATYRNAAPGGWLLGAYSRQNSVEDKTDATKPVVKKDKHVCGLFVYQKFAKLVGNNAEVAGQLEYNLTKKSDNTTLAVGFAFDAAPDTRVHLKVNTLSQLNFVLTQKANASTTIKGGVEVSGGEAAPRTFVELSLSA